ncbi:asparagine synthetase [Cystoisospora suis]|uniref:asparagine synthase (glutamine-hydrolyzing) n=1 Tax=Cystoisospora suis TaxID=483139 RepID=A0A2C6KU55_9APIC|nr:asparagine synthetase [Cystoisospora suis]
MCGIFAIIHSSLDPEQLRLLALERSRSLRHRGPDWNGLHIQTGKNSLSTVLVHERLAIVDPASGKQPLFDASGQIAVTVNGEIYNHIVLRDTLVPPEEVQGWTTGSDCQPLPSLYKFYGADMCDKLDGMFAFVISDGRTGEFLAARDPLGICSMYVGYASDGSVWFASEMKALMDDCEQVSVFPPGHFYDSTLNNGQGAFKRYYNPSWWWSPEKPLPTKACLVSDLREALEKSVRKRLMCDVPFGLMLDGGSLGSFIVAAIAAREFAKVSASEMDSHLWTHQLHTFSIGLKDSKDLHVAKKVAEVLGTVHHAFTIEIEEGLNALEDVISLIETYDVPTVRKAVPMYLLCRLIKSLGIKVVLTGEGANEVFGALPGFDMAPNKEAFFCEQQKCLDLLQYFDLLRASKASMAWGVEARVPFLDREFLDFVMTRDPAENMWGSMNKDRLEKQNLRDAFKGYLPDDLLYRPTEGSCSPDVCGLGDKWIPSLTAYAEKRVTDLMMSKAGVLFPTNTPTTKEGYLYRMIFAKCYNKNCAARTVHPRVPLSFSCPPSTDMNGRVVQGEKECKRIKHVHVEMKAKEGAPEQANCREESATVYA